MACRKCSHALEQHVVAVSRVRGELVVIGVIALEVGGASSPISSIGVRVFFWGTSHDL